MPIKTISDHLYRVRIHFIYKEPMDKAYQLVAKNGDFCSKEHFEKCFKKASGFVIWAAEQDICLILTANDGQKATAGTAAHEIFHVVDNIFSDKGIRLTESSSESYAYYIGWLMDQLVVFCKEVETKPKRSKLNKRHKTMKSKPAKAKTVSKPEFKKYVAKDKKDDMKMLKSAIRRSSKSRGK